MITFNNSDQAAIPSGREQEAGAFMTERMWYLKRCKLFEQLPIEEIQALESVCRYRKFARGNPVYLPAEQADAVLLVLTGRVKICSFTSEGKQSILAFVDPGELFGELAVLGEDTRDEYAEALEASSVLLIPRVEMQRLLARYPQLTLGISKLIGLRRKRIERRLRYLLFHSNRQRLIHLLSELAEQYGRETVDGIDLQIKLSHQDLASIIGSTRETVTVILGELQNEKFLKMGRRRITLTDAERLARSVHAQPPKVPSSLPLPPSAKLRNVT